MNGLQMLHAEFKMAGQEDHSMAGALSIAEIAKVALAGADEARLDSKTSEGLRVTGMTGDDDWESSPTNLPGQVVLSRQESPPAEPAGGTEEAPEVALLSQYDLP